MLWWRELLRSAKHPQQFEDLYERLKIEQEGEDDILYYVLKDGKSVLVRRLSEEKIYLDLDWRLSFYLNLVTHIRFEIGYRLYNYSGKELISRSFTIYASPSELPDCKHGKCKMVYPLMSFQPTNSEQLVPMNAQTFLDTKLSLGDVTLFEHRLCDIHQIVKDAQMIVFKNGPCKIVYQVEVLNPVRHTIRNAIKSLLSSPHRSPQQQYLCRPILIQIPIDQLLAQMAD